MFDDCIIMAGGSGTRLYPSDGRVIIIAGNGHQVDISRITALGFLPKISLPEGIRLAYRDFVDQQSR
jgi:nucleoside-diphosphate-sugar epimerase